MLGMRDLLARRNRAIWLMFAIAVTGAAMVVTLSIQAALDARPSGEVSDVPAELPALIFTLDAVLAVMTLTRIGGGRPAFGPRTHQRFRRAESDRTDAKSSDVESCQRAFGNRTHRFDDLDSGGRRAVPGDLPSRKRRLRHECRLRAVVVVDCGPRITIPFATAVASSLPRTSCRPNSGRGCSPLRMRCSAVLTTGKTGTSRAYCVAQIARPGGTALLATDAPARRVGCEDEVCSGVLPADAGDLGRRDHAVAADPGFDLDRVGSR